MASAVTICNGALIKCGAARIGALNENTVEAKLCNARYEENLKDLLRAHPWNFATGWATPAVVALPPDTMYGNAFQLPGDCLRVIETNCPVDQWKVEGDLITADIADLKIRYIKYVTDPNLMDENFREVLSCKIAADIGFSLTQNQSRCDALMNEYKSNLRTARSFNGQESAPPRVYADSWLNARR